LFDAGKLNKEQSFWFLPRPREELYDTLADPDEVHNLASDPAYGERLAELREALKRWEKSTDRYSGMAEAKMADAFWPGGQQPVTLAPLVSVNERNELLLQNKTADASILYRLDEGSWQLYTEPLDLAKDGSRIRAKSVRYGWAESHEVRYHHKRRQP
ncbi:MAG: hypothetical protein ACR2PJ_06860, partial [Pseudomonadales bacterium]